MITFEDVTKRYADGTVAVDSLSLEVPRGTITLFVADLGRQHVEAAVQVVALPLIEPAATVARFQVHQAAELAAQAARLVTG